MPRRSAAAHRALVEERRSQILTAAAQVFAAKGYERSTIADIARRAHVAEGSIYNYFKSKGDLLVSLPRLVILPQIENLATRATPSSPEEALTIMVRTTLTAMRDNIHIFRIMLSALPSMTKEMRQEYLEQVILHAIGIFQVYFEEQIRRGTFRRDLTPSILAQSFVGMFFPTIILPGIFQVELPQAADLEQVIQTCVQAFLHGVMSAPNSRRPSSPAQENR